MTQTYAQSCDRFNNYVTITIKNTTWAGSNKFMGSVFENNKLFEFRGLGSKLLYH